MLYLILIVKESRGAYLCCPNLWTVVHMSLQVKHLTCHLCCIQVDSFFKESGIEVRDYDEVSSDVVLLSSNQLNSSSAVKETPTDVQANGRNEVEGNNNNFIWVDPGSCCYALYSKLNSDKVLLQPSPLALAKALKVVLALSNQ